MQADHMANNNKGWRLGTSLANDCRQSIQIAGKHSLVVRLCPSQPELQVYLRQARDL